MIAIHIITELVGSITLISFGIWVVLWVITSLNAALVSNRKLKQQLVDERRVFRLELEGHLHAEAASIKERLMLYAELKKVGIHYVPNDPDKPLWRYVSVPAGDRQQIDKLTSEGWELQLASEGSGVADAPRAPTLFFKRRMDVAT